MENQTREFGLFIDGLRLERNMSREDLCEGIMSLSQYKRYLRGDTSIPNGKLVLIANRLKFSINDIHFMFRKKHNSEYQKILKIYEMIKSNRFAEAYDIVQDYKNTLIVSEYNKLFFDFCFIKIQHALKLVSDIHVLQMYSNLINYPECTNNDSFNMVEITVLIEIVRISSFINNYEPLEIMYRLLTSDTFQYSTSEDSTFMPSIYSAVANMLGKQKEHQKVLDITNQGIDYCIKYETSNALAHLFFYNSIANKNLNKMDASFKSIKKCFMHLYIEDKKEKFESFKTQFERIFEIDLNQIIQF